MRGLQDLLFYLDAVLMNVLITSRVSFFRARPGWRAFQTAKRAFSTLKRP